MVKETVTTTVENVEYEEVEQTQVYCDGCGDPTDEYETYVDVDVDEVKEQFESLEMYAGTQARSNVDQVFDDVDEVHFCPGCERGIEENQQIPALKTPPTEETDDGGAERSSWRDLKISFDVIGVIEFAAGVMFFAGVLTPSMLLMLASACVFLLTYVLDTMTETNSAFWA